MTWESACWDATDSNWFGLPILTAQFGKLDSGFLTWAERVERFGGDIHEGYYDHQRAQGFYPPYLWRNGESHEFVLVNNLNRRMGSSALISGDGWKLIVIDREKDYFQLYTIKTDNEERIHLETKYPEKVATLKAVMLSELDSGRPDLDQFQ